VELYLERWNAEVDLRTLKTQYHLAQLTAKTPAVVRKEVYSTLLAYNCAIALMAKSEEAPRLLSHTRCRQMLLMYAERMTAAATVILPTLFKDCLRFLFTGTLFYIILPLAAIGFIVGLADFLLADGYELKFAGEEGQ